MNSKQKPNGKDSTASANTRVSVMSPKTAAPSKPGTDRLEAAPETKVD